MIINLMYLVFLETKVEKVFPLHFLIIKDPHLELFLYFLTKFSHYQSRYRIHSKGLRGKDLREHNFL